MKINKDRKSQYFIEGLEPKYIIIHCCGYEPEKILDVFDNFHVSAHYFLPDPKYIDEAEEYTIYQLVNHEENRAARHAGESRWQKDTDLNECSLALEFNTANYANALKEIDFDYFDNFLDRQITAGIELILSLMEKYNIPRENILGHSDIAPWRRDESGKIIKAKTDPGPLFPWKKLAHHGIGLWPLMERTRHEEWTINWETFQALARTFGYGIDVTGEFDLKTQHVFNEFMRHYFPEQCMGNNLNKPNPVLNENIIICLENLIDRHCMYSDFNFTITNTI